MTTLPPLGFGVTGTLPLRLNDAHCHFFSSRFFDVLGRQKGLPGDAPGLEVTRLVGWDHPGTPEALADRWAEALTAGGVGRALLIGSVPGEEEQVARAVARHPDRFVGAFMLDPTQEGALTRVAWALIAARHARGVPVPRDARLLAVGPARPRPGRAGRRQQRRRAVRALRRAHRRHPQEARPAERVRGAPRQPARIAGTRAAPSRRCRSSCRISARASSASC